MGTLLTESKAVIISEIENGVRIFDKTKPTCLATDWSKDGLEFWLFQKHCSCTGDQPFCCNYGWKTTLVGSRFTHPARFLVLGCQDLVVAVGHKPLLKLLGIRTLDEISNPRLPILRKRRSDIDSAWFTSLGYDTKLKTLYLAILLGTRTQVN